MTVFQKCTVDFLVVSVSMRDVMMLRRVLEPVVGVAASMTMFAVMVVVNVPVPTWTLETRDDIVPRRPETGSAVT